ncbi:VOC family protein [Oceanobacillus sojae]|uniref:VOC family protein n=1 Tax=Oceanobacillus sojae TaxID=582851 RepID=UPI0011BDF063|nr:VOC family protein [Oceanobacillus sojae]
MVVPVKDLNRSIDFYKNVLHLEQTFTDESMAFFLVRASEEKTTILLHLIDEPEPVEKGVVIEFLVNDVTSAISSMKRKHTEVIQEPVNRPWGVKEAVISDPDGYRIWIVENLTHVK